VPLSWWPWTFGFLIQLFSVPSVYMPTCSILLVTLGSRTFLLFSLKPHFFLCPPVPCSWWPRAFGFLIQFFSAPSVLYAHLFHSLGDPERLDF
jgi:hypothetical protein